MKLNREQLLQELEAVQPGLARKEVVQQTASFIFKNGEVITCNDEIFCKIKSSLDIEGAVYADRLLQFLKKSKEDEVELIPKKGELLVKGHKQRAYVRMERDILLPLEVVDEPGKWRSLNEDFADAISLVYECASDDQSNRILTFVHITSNRIEAADNFQGMRYKIKTKFEEKTLLRKNSVKYVSSLGMTHFSETESWVHFKNPAGLHFSCRKWDDRYPSLSQFFKVSGQKGQFPKALVPKLQRADLWSSEIKDKDAYGVTVSLVPGEIRVRAMGVTGRYVAEEKMKYRGKPVEFLISPKLLVEVIDRHNKLEISGDGIKVNGGKFEYVVVLGEPKKQEKTE